MRKIGVAGVVVLVGMVGSPASASERYGSRAMRAGMQGTDVKLLQRYLTRAGFRATADGQFGPATGRAVRGWENAAERRPNGVVSRPEARLIRNDARSGAEDTGEPEGAGGSQPGQTEAPGERAELTSTGLAVPPASAPPEVKAVIEAGNRIAKKPYRYGGGHGSWEDSGYDCSGSMSYALHGGGFLGRPLDSSEFMTWGAPGRGEWITTYAHGGHSYMIVAGLRFDTSGRSERGTRWTDEMRSPRGYRVRHPDGY
jgi:cell wall-associated NlpC family hydrolase